MSGAANPFSTGGPSFWSAPASVAGSFQNAAFTQQTPGPQADFTLPPGFLANSTGTPAVLPQTLADTMSAPGAAPAPSYQVASILTGVAGTVAAAVMGLELGPAILIGAGLGLGSQILSAPQTVTNAENSVSQGITSAGHAISSGAKSGASIAEMGLLIGGLYLFSTMRKRRA